MLFSDYIFWFKFCKVSVTAKDRCKWINAHCIADYGETKIKWKTKALSESTEFNCGGTHKHDIWCITGNFETKHKSPNNGQWIAFHVEVNCNEKEHSVI